MKFAAKTDIGKKREQNEDSYGIISQNGMPLVLLIADGMGGHNSGEIASRLAVDYIGDYIKSNTHEFSDENIASEKLADLIEKTNQYIIKSAINNQKNSGMGTTLIAAVILGNRLFIGHVGDSRVYLIRDGDMKQITTDHSYIEELLKAGTITKEEAFNHPKKNIITRALGLAPDIKIDSCVLDLKTDDSLVLCTDGLTNMLHDEEIKNIAINEETPEKACDKLVEAAINKGGEDNITVIIIKGI